MPTENNQMINSKVLAAALGDRKPEEIGNFLLHLLSKLNTEIYKDEIIDTLTSGPLNEVALRSIEQAFMWDSGKSLFQEQNEDAAIITVKDLVRMIRSFSNPCYPVSSHIDWYPLLSFVTAIMEETMGSLTLGQIKTALSKMDGIARKPFFDFLKKEGVKL